VAGWGASDTFQGKQLKDDIERRVASPLLQRRQQANSHVSILKEQAEDTKASFAISDQRRERQLPPSRKSRAAVTVPRPERPPSPEYTALSRYETPKTAPRLNEPYRRAYSHPSHGAGRVRLFVTQ